jgi:hypothetical protein
VRFHAGVEDGGLLDRDAEQAVLRDVLDRAGAGAGAVVALEGEAGAGKSALLGWCTAEAARRGFVVLAARGAQLERGFAHGGLRQLLDRAPDVPAAPEEPLHQLLAGGPDPPEPMLLHALHRWLVTSSAVAPVLLAVDDAQWVDDATMRALPYLAARSGDLAVAVVVAIRTADPDLAHQLLALAVDDGGGRRLALSALSVDATAQLAARQLGRTPDQAVAEELHRLTSGNPFLVTELVRALVAEGCPPGPAAVPVLRSLRPDGIRRAVRRRLDDAGPEAARCATPRRSPTSPRTSPPSPPTASSPRRSWPRRARRASSTPSSATSSATTCPPAAPGCCTRRRRPCWSPTAPAPPRPPPTCSTPPPPASGGSSTSSSARRRRRRTT